MRIVHVFKDACPPMAAGITRYMADLAAASATRGADVEILVAGVRSTRLEHRPDGVAIRSNGGHKLGASSHAQLGCQRLLAPLVGPLQRVALSRAARVFASSETLSGASELEPVA